MFETLLAPAYLPFAIAFAVMLGVGLIETIGLGIGESGGDADGAGALDWLGLAGLPVLIWLTALLGCFTLVGVAIQQVATGLLGAPLHPGIAAGGALVAGGVLNGFVARGLAGIMPGYESSVISTDDLVMRRGIVLEGSAARGRPARARVIDRHRQAHYVMVEPHHDGQVIGPGQSALLVRREGGIFFAVPDADPGLGPV